MIKKILISVSLLALFPSGVAAATLEPIRLVEPIGIKPVELVEPPIEITPIEPPEILYVPWHQHYTAKPGHPVNLAGCRRETGEGRGIVSYTDFAGNVSIKGKGIVAIKKETGTEWKKAGFRRVNRRGDWIVFQGKGNLYAKGTSLDLKFIGKGSTNASGCGESNYRGSWEIDVWRRFWPIPWPRPIPLPDPIPLPIELHTAVAETN